MHRVSELAKFAHIYVASGSTDEERLAAVDLIDKYPDLPQTIRNLNLEGPEAMERTRLSKNLAATHVTCETSPAMLTSEG